MKTEKSIKTHSVKKALIASILVLCLCITTLAGTTFAWFTDGVTSEGNIIKTGKLDIDMMWADGDEDPAAANWIDASTGAIFNSQLWEPGYTEARHINIINKGTLALKYQLLIEPTGEVTDLANVIDVYFIEGGEKITRDGLKAHEPVGTLAKLIKGGITFGSLTAGEDRVFTIVLKMQESAGNEYQEKEIGSSFAIKLLATQYTYESDSISPDYDEDAWHPDMVVTNASDLIKAIQEIKEGGVIALAADLTFDANASYNNGGWIDGLYYEGDKSFTLDLNGNTITNDSAINDYLLNFKNAGEKPNTITIKNGTIEAASSAYCAICTSTTSTQKITINLENVNLIGNNSNGAVAKIRGGAELNVKSGTVITGKNSYVGIEAVGTGTVVNFYDGAEIYQNGTTSYVGSLIGVSNSATANVYGGYGKSAKGGFIAMTSGGTINVFGGEWIANTDGTYANGNNSVLIAQSDKGAKSTINITGGTFKGGYNCYGNAVGDAQINISAGTFNADPANFVADGFKSVGIDGTYYVVANNVAGVVTKPEALKDALTSAGAAGAGNTTIAFFGNIDMSGSTWTPIKVDGYNGADIVTIEGNGATITGLTAPLFAGGFAGGSGIVIKDLTIADSNIVSKNTIGSGAFIESVDSMATITLTNCHLVNSTVTGGDGSRTGGLIGWTAGYNNVNDGPVKTYVTISDCSVIDCTIKCNGSVGAIYGHAGNNAWTYSTVENCTVKGCDLISTDDGAWRVGVVVGTANVGELTISNITASDNTLTQTGKIAPTGQSNLYGRFVPGTTGTLVIDGASVLPAATTEALNNAIASGETNVYLPAGEYKMPSSGNSNTLVITGTKDAVVDVTLGAYMDYANVTFEGVTIKTGTGKVNGNGADYAAFYSKDVTYKNCTFEGPMRVGRDGAKFIECTFNNLGNDYIWTYGNDVTFERCTFNTDGKAILVYSDGGNEVAKVTVKDCTFNSTQGAKAGAIANQNCAAIEIHNWGNGVDLVTEGNTYDANFSGEWRIKTYENGRTKVFVNGTEYTTIALDGKIMTIDANKNVTVQ